MIHFLIYLLKSSICLCLFYVFYLLLFRTHTNFKNVRIYLIVSIFLSLAIPFNSITFQVPEKLKSFFISPNITHVVQNDRDLTQETKISNTIDDIHPQRKVEIEKNINWVQSGIILYLVIAIVLFCRFMFFLIHIVKRYYKSEIQKSSRYTIVIHPKIRYSYSFFSWIFVNKQDLSPGDYNKIIAHEIIHVSQYHSVDLIIIELLAAAMWFNPVIWFYRKTLQLVHEYLADEGALGTGLDKLQYQALLINQIAEEKLICLSSGFNHSLIKKRIVMMTKSKFNQQTKLKIFALVPITLVLLLGTSLTNKRVSPANGFEIKSKLIPEMTFKSKELKVVKSETNNLLKNNKTEKKSTIVSDTVVATKQIETNTDVVTAVAPTKMNVLYLGVENPVEIAVSGYRSSDIKVTIDNGIIKHTDGKYVAYPIKVGIANISVLAKDKLVKVANFRVKSVPDPVIMIGRKKGGKITKDNLINDKKVDVVLENFDFDARFTVTSFTISTNIAHVGLENKSENVHEISSDSNLLTPEQIELIKKLNPGDKVIFSTIKATDPAGTIRELNGTIFTITE